MNKIILTLYLFCSLVSAQVVFDENNIFQNGSVDLTAVHVEQCENWKYSVYSFESTVCSSYDPSNAVGQGEAYLVSAYGADKISGCRVNQETLLAANGSQWRINVACDWDYNGGNTQTTDVYAVLQGLSETKECPAEGYPDNTAMYAHNDSANCYDPDQADLVDSCNSSSGNSVLSIGVTDSVGCFTQPDGSVCEYQGVDVGGGNQVYQMNLEGSCYLEPAPSLDDNPSLGGTPTNDQCVNNGGLLTCPEDPENVCTQDGSSYGGGSINSCQAGCGYVNDSFVCYDIDTDSDGLADYNDPDVDGDGIANGDDLDADGDGFDDPINGGNTSGSGSGGSVTVDMSGVISELKKANTSLDNLEDSFKTDHGLTPDDLNKDDRITNLNNDYKTEMEDFIAKGSAELGYVDTLVLGNAAGISGAVPVDGCAPYSMQVGSLGEYTIDLCKVSAKTNPILFWVFGFLTSFYAFIRVNQTLRGET